MTIKENCQLILRKYPETKFSRGLFMFQYICEFFGANIYILKDQFLEFWQSEASIERELRECLKEPEFALPVEAESKRYEKEAEFKRWKDHLPEKEQADFEKAFGVNKEEFNKYQSI